MKAVLKNYRQAPRKVRIVADLIRGKRIIDAQMALSFLPKRASDPLLKLLNSAVANAVAKDVDIATLVISEIRVDKGVILKRMMPRARGSSAPIHKHSSHVILSLAAKETKKEKKAAGLAKKAMTVVEKPKKVTKKKVAPNLEAKS